MLTKPVRAWSISALVGLALVGASCTKNGNGSPTGPDAQKPGGNSTVQVTINPNPVPFSGVPVTDTPGCATLPNTWYYDQVFNETGGTPVTFNARIDYFDGFVVNDLQGLNIQIQSRGALTLKARWCSGNPTTHTAQSTFSGVDGTGKQVTLTTALIRLQAP